MALYLAKSRGDMLALADRVRTVPETTERVFAAALLAAGVMRTNRIVHFAVWLGTKLRRRPAMHTWLTLFLHPKGMNARDMIEGAAAWIADGKDADGEGAGGLNQAEVALVTRLVAIAEG